MVAPNAVPIASADGAAHPRGWNEALPLPEALKREPPELALVGADCRLAPVLPVVPELFELPLLHAASTATTTLTTASPKTLVRMGRDVTPFETMRTTRRHMPASMITSCTRLTRTAGVQRTPKDMRAPLKSRRHTRHTEPVGSKRVVTHVAQRRQNNENSRTGEFYASTRRANPSSARWPELAIPQSDCSMPASPSTTPHTRQRRRTAEHRPRGRNHVMGVRTTPARRRVGRLDWQRRRRVQQRSRGELLRHAAAPVPRPMPVVDS
jgi:hypothetical protein